MSKSVDESQTAQENTPQQAGEKKVKSKQPHQVTNDIKWVPFLIGFHLVTQALNRLSLRRPSAPRCRFGVVGTASLRSWYRCSAYPVLQGVFFHS